MSPQFLVTCAIHSLRLQLTPGENLRVSGWANQVFQRAAFTLMAESIVVSPDFEASKVEWRDRLAKVILRTYRSRHN